MPSEIGFFFINLDCSSDRRANITAGARRAGIDIIRVPALRGEDVTIDLCRCDHKGFRRLHGKEPLAGEFGCYASHLKALCTFLDSDLDVAVILEDDAVLRPDFADVVSKIAAMPAWDVVRLRHHRLPLFRPLASPCVGYSLGVGAFGPTGSAAAYMVTRKAARVLVQSLYTMRLPFDVALERGWSNGLRILSLRPDLVDTYSESSTVTSGASYSHQQLAWHRRIETLLFRATDLVRRVGYCGRLVWHGTAFTGRHKSARVIVAAGKKLAPVSPQPVD